MNTRNLKWLRLRNWAVVVALAPVAFVVALVLSPVIGAALAAQFVDEELKGGLK